MKFLFDLFPILLFFAAYKFYGIFTATAVAIGASFAQIGWVWLRHRKVDTMLWLSLGIITVFGGATLALHDATFIKWKPTVLYWLFAAVLLVSEIAFKKNLIKAMMQKQMSLPENLWGRLNFGWIVFFILVGIANLYVAFNFSENAWVNFKLFGILGLMFAFVLGQGLLLAKYVEVEDKDAQ